MAIAGLVHFNVECNDHERSHRFLRDPGGSVLELATHSQPL